MRFREDARFDIREKTRRIIIFTANYCERIAFPRYFVAVRNVAETEF